MNDRITEIRARLDAATPGPWGVWDDGTMIYAPDPDAPGAYLDVAIAFSSLGDQHLIANAPADIAWLLEEVERLRAESRAGSAHLTPDPNDDNAGPILGPDDFPADDPARPDA